MQFAKFGEAEKFNVHSFPHKPFVFEKSQIHGATWHVSCKTISRFETNEVKNFMNDEQYSYRQSELAACITGTSKASEADAAVLADRIQTLVANCRSIVVTRDRSPLFQVAAHLDVPQLPQCPEPHKAITEEIFAHVRNEALKTQSKRQSNRNPSPKRQEAHA